MFISFEGTEGSGKTTQIKEVFSALRDKGHNPILTREPGGTDISNQIRAIVLDNLENQKMQPRTELLLFCASRAQLVGEFIKPNLAEGKLILCDRYAVSTLAYQGYGHGLPLDDLRQILNFATGGLYPDLTIYLDLPPEKGLERRRKGQMFGESWNRLDDKELTFHQKVYAGYEAIIAENPARFLRINADQQPEAVTAEILRGLLPRL
jgi:dTMP kinase